MQQIRINADNASASALLALVSAGVALPVSAKGDWTLYNVSADGLRHLSRGKKFLNIPGVAWQALEEASVIVELCQHGNGAGLCFEMECMHPIGGQS